MMSLWRGRVVGLCLAMAVGSMLVAQEKKTEAKTEAKSEAKAQKKKPAGRLPANYGKLNLSEDQKAKIYGIQSTYDAKLKDLESQLKALRDMMNSEIEAALTADQAKVLAGIKEEAKKKAAEKAKPNADAKAETKTEASKGEPAKTETEKKPTDKKVEAPKKP